MDLWPDVNADQLTIRQLFEKEAAHVNEVGQGRMIRLLGAAVGFRAQRTGEDMGSKSTCNQIWDFATYGSHRNAWAPALIKLLSLISDAPSRSRKFCAENSLKAETMEKGRQLRARLPAYDQQRSVLLTTHCPLPAVLQDVVAAYAEPTRADVWDSMLL
jgi:hypothetical protein